MTSYCIYCNIVVSWPTTKVWGSLRLSEHYIHSCVWDWICAEAVCLQVQSKLWSTLQLCTSCRSWHNIIPVCHSHVRINLNR